MDERSIKAILYYSKRCPHCAEVLNMIRLGEQKVNNFSNYFAYVLVDGNSKLPSYITEVPTLVVPTHDRPLTGTGVFMWIETNLRKMMTTNQKQPERQTSPQQQSQPQQSPSNDGGVMFYNPLEMSSGFGDCFSFIDGGEVQEHCFTFIDEQGNKQVKCVPAGGNGSMDNRQQPQAQQQAQQQNLPDWLKPQSVGKQSYDTNSRSNSYNTTYNPDVSNLTMSQQNNIRLQQQARMNNSPAVPPNFQDPQRQQMNDTNKITDKDYERFISSRNSDNVISAPLQRI